MLVTVELIPDLEAKLSTLAPEQGLSLSDYVRQVLESHVPCHDDPISSPAERAEAWRQSVRQLPRTQPLADEAISRDSIYDARG